jgi:RES domain-containing protein
VVIYRIADRRHPIWDGTGAALVGGRWNSPGRPVIYGALSFACAMLEVLVHAGIGRIPATHQLVTATAPEGQGGLNVHRYSVETLQALAPNWDSEDSSAARALGDAWLTGRRSAILVVPSVVARLEFNALVNPHHPDAQRLVLSVAEPVIWDKRLFRV